ncbi:MAG TPA: acyl-CoA dehydrogenase family protein [Acidimicrobiales bacterium]|nr:acyl-CoA dehydrogenase family protein [Acidimicrobiales bacterium]
MALATDIAENVLLANALRTDQADLVDGSNLDALAGARLYGLFGPVELGGYAADLPTACAVIEQLASGCLTTTLVWMQHHGLVGSLLTGPAALRDRLLADLCTGARRSGIVFTGLIPGPSPLEATRRDGGWALDGSAPWVSGWGRIDVLQIAARSPDDTVVTIALDDLDRPGLVAHRHRLAALDASGTVRLDFAGLQIDDAEVISVVAHDPAAAGGQRLRLNGSLALGVARRCCALIGPSPLDDELNAVRDQLDRAGDDGIADARAAAALFANRAATRLVVTTGSRALDADRHAQRLMREAMFLLVFGSRPAIKSALLDRL